METVPTFKRRKRPQGSIPITTSDSNQLIVASDDEELATSETLEELIALRKLRKTMGGIDLERLNAGERKKKKKKVEGEDEAAKEKERIEQEQQSKSSIIRSNNFTGQTNAIDVDKHMMAYIEDELRKRRGAGSSSDFDSEKELRALDPRDALYTIAEKYRVEKARTEEGNVQLSTAMLTAIPEVDLGIDIRLKNIEETEKAKRVLFEAKSAKKEEDEFAADRFYRARRPLESDGDALAKARREAAEGPAPEKTRPAGAGRKETSTDDQTMDRFKKRQHNQGKR